MNRKPLAAAVMTACLLGLAACDRGTAPKPARSGPPAVYAVNHPVAYFATRIAGDRIRLHQPFPADGDPAFWKPDEQTIGAFQGADLILLNGAGYAKWYWDAKAPLPPSRLVDTSAAFADTLIRLKGTARHAHGKAGAHTHAGVDFNTWLDPIQAQQQAKVVLDALSRLLPEAKAEMAEAAKALATDLAALDAELAALSNAATPGLIASHPVYGYVGRRYGWDLRSLHWEPDAMPDEAAWAALDKMLKDKPAVAIVWEDEPDPAIAAKVAERGLKNVVFRPCGNRPAEGDYIVVMKANIEAIRPLFKRAP